MGGAAVAVGSALLLALAGHGRLTGARRSLELNRRLHELRRPLQGVALALDAGPANERALACFEQASGALADLDACVNGRPPRRAMSVVPLRDVLEDARRRWGSALTIDPATADPRVEADPRGLAGALDNLVANALEHGRGRVSLRLAADGREARLEVRDQGPGTVRSPSRRDPRRGHGLAQVAAVAERHSGRAGLGGDPDGGTVATLALPLASPAPGGGGGRG